MDLLEETIQDIKTANSELDIILYDRHWMTILSETDHRPKLKYYWTNFIPTIFAEATIEKILMCSRFSFDIPWTKSREQVEKYHQIYLHLAKKYQENIYDKFLVTDKSQDLTPIITSVSETIIKTYELT